MQKRARMSRDGAQEEAMFREESTKKAMKLFLMVSKNGHKKGMHNYAALINSKTIAACGADAIKSVTLSKKLFVLLCLFFKGCQ